ncbi:MAG: FAD-dependent monooxygenase, partial [Rhodospirillaceae bacterium]|nr:FAD-dependent monooxygenase [Rhodospirillaceae bacterium]
VIVAGAGPVGLTAALILAKGGVDVVMLERRSDLNRMSKASTFHPPTLEILADFGLLDVLTSQGQLVPKIQYREQGKGILAEFHLAELAAETTCPFRIHLEQAAVMPLLLEQLVAQPTAQVLFEAEVVAVSQNGSSIQVSTTGPRGAQKWEGDYLLVTEGARSTTRDLLGIAFEGETYEERVLRVFTRMDLDEILPGIAPLTYLYVGNKSLSFLKMPDLWRMVLRAPPQISNDEAISPGYFMTRLRDYFGPDTEKLRDVWADVFEVGKRVASTYLQGRAIVMGDAAHISTTRGGMNMNCGVHDAYALAHALLGTLRTNDNAILADCAAERRRVAREELLSRTDKAASSGAEWLAFATQCAADQGLRLKFLRSVTMLDMRPLAYGHAS